MRSGERFFSQRAAAPVKLRACSMHRILEQLDHGRHGAVRPVGVVGEDSLHDGVVGLVDPQIDLPQLLRLGRNWGQRTQV